MTNSDSPLSGHKSIPDTISPRIAWFIYEATPAVSELDPQPAVSKSDSQPAAEASPGKAIRKCWK
jgi:hypothetical protein